MRTLLIELLSWGIPPEAFVQLGLSREAILVLSRDLRIRLPQTLLAAATSSERELLAFLSAQR